MSLDDLKEGLARRAGRLRHDLGESRERHRLDRELDRLFSELGIEVYQRMREGEPVEGSVVVRDLVERLREVEDLLAEHATSGEEE